jgi:hypothetical protein
MSELIRTQKLKAEQERLERLIQVETVDVNVEKLLQGQTFANGVLMHMATTNEALKRIDESMVDVKHDMNDIKVNGLRICAERKGEMDLLKANDEAQRKLINTVIKSNGSGDWLRLGNWKAAGLPAIILAIFIGIAVYQRWETKGIAKEVNTVKESQELLIHKQAMAIAQKIIAEIEVNRTELRK